MRNRVFAGLFSKPTRGIRTEQKGNVVSARKARTLLEELRETASA